MQSAPAVDASQVWWTACPVSNDSYAVAEHNQVCVSVEDWTFRPSVGINPITMHGLRLMTSAKRG